MRPALDDAALLEDEDLVGVGDGRQPVGDHQRRAPLAGPTQGVLDGRLGAGVQGAGRLVEDQHPGIGQQGAGQAHPLTLAAGQLQPTLANLGGHSVGQALDEAGQFRRLGRGDHLRRRGVRPAEGDVDLQGVVEQGHVLRHQGHRPAQGGHLQVAQVDSVDAHPARLWIDQPQGQPHQGGLAGPRRADQGHGGSRHGPEADLGQALRPRAVAEGHGLENHLAALPVRRRRQGLGVLGLGHIGGLAAQVEHGFHVDERLADFAVGEAEDVQRGVEVDHDQHGGGDVARPHAPGGRLVAGHHRHHRQAQAHHRRLHGVEQGQGVGRLDLGGGVGVQGGVIVGHGAGLGAEGLDRLVVDQGVHGAAGGLLIGLVERPAMGDPPVRDGEGQDHIDHHRGHGGGGEAPVVLRRQHPGGDEQLDDRRGQVEHQRPQQKFHRPRAPVDDPREGAGALALVEVHRQRQGVGEGLRRRAGLGRLGHRGDDGVAGLGRGGGQEADQGPAKGHAGEGRAHLHPGALTLRQFVDRRPQQQGRGDAGDLARQRQAEGRRQPPPQPRRL